MEINIKDVFWYKKNTRNRQEPLYLVTFSRMKKKKRVKRFTIQNSHNDVKMRNNNSDIFPSPILVWMFSDEIFC